MIQADAVSTPAPGLFATLKSLLFSGGVPRRTPNVAERAALRGLALKTKTAIEGHAALSDAALVNWLDREILEPLRELVRGAAANWTEPYLGMLTNALCEGDGNVASFQERLIDRADVIDAIDALGHALRLIARS